MSNYNCLTMMILRKCRANYEELTSLINTCAQLRMVVAHLLVASKVVRYRAFISAVSLGKRFSAGLISDR